ncbi:MAG TPA: hypothetical protein VF648_15265 [Pyrinomonadaceae bacterium]
MKRNNSLIAASANGNGIKNLPVEDGEHSHQQGDARPPSGKQVGKGVDIYFTMQTGLKDFAKERIVKGGYIDLDEAVLQFLEEHARAIAEQTYQLAYDPEKLHHDKLRDDENKRNLKEVEFEREAVKHGEIELNLREDAYGKAKAKVPPRPEFPVLTAVFGTLVITTAVAVTLHDIIFYRMGAVWGWTFSILVGLAWGAFVVFSILDGAHHSENNEKPANQSRLGLIGGIGMSVALGLLRLMYALTLWGVIGAVAFTALEIFICFLLEHVNRNHAAREQKFAAENAAAQEAAELVEATRIGLKRRYERIAEFEGAIRNHCEYVEERHHRSTQKEQFIESAIKAVRDGAAEGLAINRGKILGLK